nr:MAG: hypothetical protein [Bacteriophage sp.]
MRWERELELILTTMIQLEVITNSYEDITRGYEDITRGYERE